MTVTVAPRAISFAYQTERLRLRISRPTFDRSQMFRELGYCLVLEQLLN